jgi:hypothetical protein
MKSLHRTISKDKFNRLLIKTHRIWNGDEGLEQNQAKRDGIDIHGDMDYILERNDGWKIATSGENFHSAFRLWSDEWSVIYTKS